MRRLILISFEKVANLLLIAVILCVPVVSHAESAFTQEMDYGSEGSEVRKLQEFLALDSSIYPEGVISGYYGSLTVAAVRRFQSQQGLPVVGIVGPQTLEKLNTSVNPLAPSSDESSASEGSVEQRLNTLERQNDAFTWTIALMNRIKQLSGVSLTDITVSGVSGLTASDIPPLNTDSLVEGTTNLFYSNSLVQAFIHASTTIPKTYTSNTYTNANTFSGGLTIGSLNGPLQANAGAVSATTSIGATYGGTGLTATPTYGQVLVGNSSGGYTLTATSSLGLSSTSATSQSTPVDPSTTNSTTGVMMGLANSVTPSKSGTILVHVSGDTDNNTIGDGAQMQIRYGTGSAPSNGAALAGTAAGSAVKMTNPSIATLSVGRSPFSLNAVVTGLTVGATYWIDISLAAITGGTARVRDISISIVEI